MILYVLYIYYNWDVLLQIIERFYQVVREKRQLYVIFVHFVKRGYIFADYGNDFELLGLPQFVGYFYEGEVVV